MNWNKNNVIVNTNQETQEVNVEEKKCGCEVGYNIGIKGTTKTKNPKLFMDYFISLRSVSMDK